MTEPVSSSEPNQPDVATRIAELEGQVALLKDTVLRSNADQQNQQRRHHREGIELRKFATAGLLEDLLPALDSLAGGTSPGRANATPNISGHAQDALLALLALGYKGTEAQKALAGLDSTLPPGDLVREALRRLG